MASQTAPITGEVLLWALRQRGSSSRDLAESLGIAPDLVDAWIDETTQPTVGQLGKIAKALDRPRAFFLLPRPPQESDAVARFRRPPGAEDAPVSAQESRRIRWVRSTQRLLAWIAARDDLPAPLVPEASVDEDASSWGERERLRLGPPVPDQLTWSNGYDALRAWTGRLESAGVIVIQVDLGRGGLRGFSLWDDHVPVVAINSGLDVTVRAYTVFHEYGHLLTRSDWACDLGAARSTPTERWCESFAASFLVPEDALRQATEDRIERVARVEEVTALARRFRVSARAMAARLSDLNLAAPDLYRLIDRSLGTSDWTTGGGGSGETSAEKRIRQLGPRPIEMLLDAYRRGDLTRRDVQVHLRLDGHGVDEVETLARQAG